ncbi:MAG TPA: phosphoglycerate dehydrogenase [Firmicutes bacterium]|nr:phosphoglycerate dehydrogenase [Bacillota bacterium]
MKKIFATSSEFGIHSQKLIDDFLGPLGISLVRYEHRGPMSEEDLLKISPEYEAIAAYSMDAITEKVLDHFPKLKIVARHGIGFDTVDIKAAARRGIFVTNTHEGAFEERAVSDLTMGLLLALARRIIDLSASTKAGNWERPLTADLWGSTLGVIGLGRIGKMTALKAKAFGMNVIAYDIFQDEEFASAHEITYVSLDELLRRSDFVTLHCPLTEENKGLIGERELSLMKPGAFLINCARGALVDENALYEALKSGKLGGAGLDVYSKEPPKSNKLLELPNVIAMPHVGAYTHKTMNAMDMLVVKSCADALRGLRPANVVNGL